MKRILLFALLLCLSFYHLFASVTMYDEGAFRARGYVDQTASLSLSPRTQAMPFDMTGEYVQPLTVNGVDDSAALLVSPGSL